MLGPLDLVLPPLVLLSSVATLAFTITSLSLTGRMEALTSVRSLKQSWFKHFWWWFGPGTKPIFAHDVHPLLAQARGVVLELGPASGIWMEAFAPAVREGKIIRIYGVEPNVTFHAQLKAESKKHGMEDVYQPLPAYSHELEKNGVKKGSIDTIVTVHVLCSVGPQLDAVVEDLYDYLKPGGQWLVYEHVAARYTVARAWQSEFSRLNRCPR